MSHPDLDRNAGKYYGKYAGIVTKVEDDKKLGRVWVQVPAVFGGQMEVQARPCFPAAHFYVPPKYAKVWVEFEAGDPRYPIWVGVWYENNATPQPADVNPPDSRLIKTPGGHTLEFFDKSGDEKIVLRHKKNSFVSLDKDGNVTVGNDKGSFLHLNSKDQEATWMEQHSNLITMSSDGVLIVNKNGVTLEMKDDGVRILAAGTIQLSGKAIVVQGQTVGIGESAMEPTILGQTFLAMYNSHTHVTALGPSGPPLPPLLPTALTQVVKVK